MGRLVHTHSTYLEGLIDILKKLSNDINIKTITPGVISKSKGSADKIRLRISRKITGGYKLNAKKGSSVQEVYIITEYKKEELENKIAEVI